MPEDPFLDFRKRHPKAFASFQPPNKNSREGVIQVQGDLDTEVSPDFLHAVVSLMGDMESGSILVVNMEGVEYISSTGVGALAQALSEASRKRISLRLRRLSPKCQTIFSALGLLQYFELEEG